MGPLRRPFSRGLALLKTSLVKTHEIQDELRRRLKTSPQSEVNYKDDLLVAMDGVYVNTAAESPLLRCVAESLQSYALEKGRGEPGRTAFEAAVDAARRRVANLLQCSSRDVGFAYSASDALGLLTQSIPFKDGDRVVVSEIEYPSDLLVWHGPTGAQVELDLVSEGKLDWDTEAILRTIGPKTRLVVVSAVSYSTGHRVDLKRIKAAVNAQGGWLLADATQALGAVRVNADEADMIVASGFKWMMGVHGVAVLYCSPEISAQLTPPFAGWRSVQPQEQTELQSVRLKEGAERFETGMPGFPAIFGLEAGLGYLQDQVGIDEVWSRVAHLSSALYEGFRSLKLPLITRDDPDQRAGIVCVHEPDAAQVAEALKAEGVYAYAPVRDVLRFSPHFFNTAADIDRCIDVMRRICARRRGAS